MVIFTSTVPLCPVCVVLMAILVVIAVLAYSRVNLWQYCQLYGIGRKIDYE
ncbi:hypothetical protein PN455_03800 [Dolichospermum circinale CS-539]|nr:hypothetical protein [Dolichospermum circinale CS-539]